MRLCFALDHNNLISVMINGITGGLTDLDYYHDYDSLVMLIKNVFIYRSRKNNSLFMLLCGLKSQCALVGSLHLFKCRRK